MAFGCMHIHCACKRCCLFNCVRGWSLRGGFGNAFGQHPLVNFCGTLNRQMAIMVGNPCAIFHTLLITYIFANYLYILGEHKARITVHAPPKPISFHYNCQPIYKSQYLSLSLFAPHLGLFAISPQPLSLYCHPIKLMPSI